MADDDGMGFWEGLLLGWWLSREPRQRYNAGIGWRRRSEDHKPAVGSANTDMLRRRQEQKKSLSELAAEDGGED